MTTMMMVLRSAASAVLVASLAAYAAPATAQVRRDGETSPDEAPLAEANRIRTEVVELFKQRKYAEATPLAEQTLAIRERALGGNHPAVAESLADLATLYESQGAYAKAEPLRGRALAVAESAFGPDHLAVVQHLSNLATLYRAQGAYAKAEPLFARALAVREKALGPDAVEVAQSVNSLALLYREQGAYAKAEPLFARALAIGEKLFGADAVEIAPLINNLAVTYQNLGDFTRAEPLMVRSLALREKALSADDPDVAEGLNNLADLYRSQGAYAKAEPLLERALAIFEKALGSEHPFVATSANNLAAVYVAQGAYDKAEPLYARALAIVERTLGAEHPEVAQSLNNLAFLHLSEGEYAKVEPLLERALRIREGALGPEHPYVAETLSNLSRLAFEQGDYSKAEPLSARALAVAEKAFGGDHPAVARYLNNLGMVYRRQAAFAKAEPLLRRALAILESALGPEHSDVAMCLNNLAMLRFAVGDLAAAVDLAGRAGDTRESEVRRNLVAGSQTDKLLYLRKTELETHQALSMQAASGAADARALRMGLENVLRRKGRALDALVDQFGAVARAGSPEDRALLGELRAARGEYAGLTLRGPGREGMERHRAALAEARARVERLEAQVSSRSARLKAELTPVTLDAVAAALPHGTTLVEFASYRPVDPRTLTYAPARYVVFTLTPDGTVRWSDLGDASQVDALVEAFRATLRKEGGRPLAEVETVVKPRARALDAKILAPVRALVGDRKRLLIATDGQLSLVPFDALVDERGRYATERLKIVYLTSGRDLLRLSAGGASRQPVAIIANPDFGADAAGAGRERQLTHSDAASPAHATSQMSKLLERAHFTALPGTGAEATAIRAMFPEAEVATGADASKGRVLAVSGPRVLHLATHGFFLAGERPVPDVGRGLVHEMPTYGGTRALVGSAEDPLLRSGLAFAGANLHRGSDGILTSLEAAGLDLWGTKLVVLSACDTGVGVVRNGDGVYGLRRALVLAGAETQVMSLWPVSDEGTRDLMIEYYERLMDGEGRAEAMRKVRLEMLEDSKRSHPYYWASFIVSGQWESLADTGH